MIKKNHIKRAAQILIEDLEVCCNEKEAEERIYFVSAKEMLKKRTGNKNKKNQLINWSGPKLNDDEGSLSMVGNREFDFGKFEAMFEESISKLAVHAKFTGLRNTGQRIVKYINYHFQIVNIDFLLK